MKRFTKLLAFLLVFIAAPDGANASTSPWISADHMQARLISARTSIGNDPKLQGALEIRMTPGWHSYWRSPGDSGLPPVFRWDESQNIENVDVSYPAPERFKELGLQTFGYKDSVIFPINVTLAEPEKDTVLHLKLETMVCKDICIPQNLEMSITIPAGDGAEAPMAKLIERAKTKVPAKHAVKTLEIRKIEVNDQKLVVFAYSSEHDLTEADIFVEVGPMALTAMPKLVDPKPDQETGLVEFHIAPPEHVNDLGEFTKDKTVRVTISVESMAVEKELEF